MSAVILDNNKNNDNNIYEKCDANKISLNQLTQNNTSTSSKSNANNSSSSCCRAVDDAVGQQQQRGTSTTQTHESDTTTTITRKPTFTSGLDDSNGSEEGSSIKGASQTSDIKVTTGNCIVILRNDEGISSDQTTKSTPNQSQPHSSDIHDQSNTIIEECKNMTIEDLRRLICELKRKLEFNENMNWLCLTKRPAGPPHRKTSLPKHTDVKKKFLEICDQTLSEEVKAALRLPSFDSYDWDDAEVVHLMQSMFIELGLIKKFDISLVTLREWLYEVYKHYNEVPFHNFRHCFCVAQMMYAITWQTDLLNRLGYMEVLILLISCICHDLDHPGYNNIYQINARTELALRYNDISPLENHHCSIAFRLLENPDCNIFKKFPNETYKTVREGIIRCILATDMARHNEILDQFKDITPTFDYTNNSHRNSLCMVLIKVADISNEARPMDVAEPWLDRLLQEFFAQSALEKSEGLPVTPFMDPDKVSKPGSQVRFIGLVLLPLFEALGELLPELNDFIIHPVKVALDYYRRLNDAQSRNRKSLIENENSSENSSPLLPRSQSGHSVRSKKSIPSQKSASRTSIDEPCGVPVELHDLPEGSESGDSETATEVDVAEKTSKFKVDTEGCSRSKASQIDSRKGSREKRPSMCGEYYMSSSGRVVRGSHGNIHAYHTNRCNFGANRAVSLDQYGTSNRRMSEGLPAVTSDTQVFYNHFNHHLHHTHNNQQSSLFQNNCHTTTSSDTDATTTHSSSGDNAKLYEEDCDIINLNLSSCFGTSTPVNKQPSSFQQGGSNEQSGSHHNNHNQQQPIINNKLQNSSKDGATKSLFSRFRQFTGRLSFSFDKDSGGRRSPSQVSPSKNNNAEVITTKTAAGYCCSLSNNTAESPNLKPKNDGCIINSNPLNTLRNRAYSLDVPPNRNRYSSGSNDGSRKSSSSTKNEDNLPLPTLRIITSDSDDNNRNMKRDSGEDQGGGGCNI